MTNEIVLLQQLSLVMVTFLIVFLVVKSIRDEGVRHHVTQGMPYIASVLDTMSDTLLRIEKSVGRAPEKAQPSISDPSTPSESAETSLKEPEEFKKAVNLELLDKPYGKSFI